MSLTSRLPLSRTRINRDAVSRKIPGFLDQVMADSSTKVVLIWRGEALLADSSSPQIELVAPHDVPHGALLLYLGVTLETVREIPQGTRIVAAVLDDDSG